MSNILEVKDLKVAYGGIEAVRGISFDVPEGQIVTLIGANGAGKSSTLRSIVGLEKPKAGSIKFQDMDLIGIPARIVVGKKAADGVVEFKRRTDEKSTDMPTADAVEALCSFIAENK